MLHNRTYYDSARICKNGHLINQHIQLHPETNPDFCNECGQPTFTICLHCKNPIQGCRHTERERVTSFNQLTNEARKRTDLFCQQEFYKIPSYCNQCGQPFPWIEARLKAAKLLIEEDEQLDIAEKETLILNLPDIIVETPNTQLAVSRFKKITSKALTVTGEGLKNILIEICSEAIKTILWPNP